MRTKASEDRFSCIASTFPFLVAFSLCVQGVSIVCAQAESNSQTVTSNSKAGVDRAYAQYVTDGKRLFDQHAYTRSLSVFRMAIGLKPEMFGARKLAGSAAYWARQPEVALGYWDQLLGSAQKGSPQEWDLLNLRVKALFAAHKKTEARNNIIRMYRLRNQERLEQALKSPGYVLEHIFVSQFRVGVFEYFDHLIAPNQKTKPGSSTPRLWEFTVAALQEGSSGKVVGKFVLVGNHPSVGQGYQLQDITSGKVVVYGRWPKRPSYDEVRKIVVGMLKGSARPLGGGSLAAVTKQPETPNPHSNSGATPPNKLESREGRRPQPRTQRPQLPQRPPTRPKPSVPEPKQSDLKTAQVLKDLGSRAKPGRENAPLPTPEEVERERIRQLEQKKREAAAREAEILKYVANDPWGDEGKYGLEKEPYAPDRTLTKAEQARMDRLPKEGLSAATRRILLKIACLAEVRFDIASFTQNSLLDKSRAEKSYRSLVKRYPNAPEDAQKLLDYFKQAKRDDFVKVFAHIQPVLERADSDYVHFLILKSMHARSRDLPMPFVQSYLNAKNFILRQSAMLVMARIGDRTGLNLLFAELSKADVLDAAVLSIGIEELVGNQTIASSPKKKSDIKPWTKKALSWWSVNSQKVVYRPGGQNGYFWIIQK